MTNSAFAGHKVTSHPSLHGSEELLRVWTPSAATGQVLDKLGGVGHLHY